MKYRHCCFLILGKYFSDLHTNFSPSDLDSIPASLQLHSPTITMPNLRLSLVYRVDAADKIAEPGNVFFKTQEN